VWVDHNLFTDAPVTDDQLPIENGMRKQCHDGALDIGNASDYVTVSYNRFMQHEKNMLIGSGDDATGDEGHLRVTIHHNIFEDVAERSPRVRYGRVHVYNNLYLGDRGKDKAAYRHGYSIGVGHQSRILSERNVFEVAGAKECRAVIRKPSANAPGDLRDRGSLLNGAPAQGCDVGQPLDWTPPYIARLQPVTTVKADLLQQAGPGRLAATASDAASGAVIGPRPGEGAAAPAAPAFQFAQVRAATSPVAQPADYFVETRIVAQPEADGTPFRGRVYLLGRYQDERNWYGAGLNYDFAGQRMQVEIVRMQDGVFTQLKQVHRPVLDLVRPATVRLEMLGPVLTAYLNGERITFVNDATFSQAGSYGVATAKGRFQLGAGETPLVVGDASQKPPRIALARAPSRLSLQTGDGEIALPVSALGPDGATALAFGAQSVNEQVAKVRAQGQTLYVQPTGPGATTVTLTSSQDLNTFAIIDVKVSERLPALALRYPALAKATAPAPNARDLPVDTTLRLDFDNMPTLGASGTIRILRASDGKLVDTLRLTDEYDLLGYPGQPLARAIRTRHVSVQGKRATIHLHNAKLAYDTEYIVLVDDGVFKDATLGGQPFRGIAREARWRFRTRANAPKGLNLTVDDDGNADFRTVQGALNHVMQHGQRAAPATISIRNGDYDEPLYLVAKDNVTLRGESRDGVQIHYLNNDGLNPGSQGGQPARSPSVSGGRAVFSIEDADMITLDTLTMKNDTVRAYAAGGQAETLYFNSDSGRLAVKNASFHSEQDTIQVKGYSWFYRTLIAGNVDFIWGNNRTALFEDSEIRTVGDSANPNNGGYVLQARTVGPDERGFIFLNSRLTHGPGPAGNGVPKGSTYLARSPGTAYTWDNIVFINCSMDEHIAPIGWAGKGVTRQPQSNPAVASVERGWREAGSSKPDGTPLDLSQRQFGRVMTAAEAQAWLPNRAAAFATYGNGKGWSPQP
jgi:pectin methylesterase-like acyl-CoA thioesterase